MAFMQPVITDKQEWLSVDGNQGTEVIPAELLHMDKVREILDAEEPDMDRLAEIAEPYLECREIFSAEIKEGYGYRLSAPGYMDCTSWAVYDTLAEAEAARDEEAEDDEEGEDEDEDA